MKQFDGLFGFLFHDMIHHLRNGEIAGQTHGGVNRLHRDVIRAGALVQKREGIAHTAVRQLGDEFRGIRIQFKGFLRCHIIQTVPDLGNADAFEGVALAPGEDGGGHLVQLRGRQDEHQVFRRLLQYLQQRVESAQGKHMDLVHDIDTFAYGSGREDGVFPQVTDVIHAVVGSGVHLHDIHDGFFLDGPAGRTHPAGISVYRVLAVDGLGKDLGTGGLAGAPGADKQICMTQPVIHDLLFQGFRDMLLTHDIVKCLGTPFPV